MSSKPYEYVEHTADLRFRAYGRSLGECFSNAASAMFAAIVDPSSIDVVEEREISLSSDKLEILLHDYLTEILFLFEDEKLVFSVFKTSVEKEDSGYRLCGKAFGEKLTSGKHSIETEIKAVTYHEMTIKERDGVWTAEVLCDI